MELNDFSPYMLVENAWDLKKLMQQNKLIMVYNGQISSKTFEYLRALAEEKLENHGTTNKIKRKILNILVETIQNISRHGIKNKSNTVASLFVIGENEDNQLFIVSGNTIARESESVLRKKLDLLNSLNPEGLRTLYLNTLQIEDFTDKGGAGLGFLDMARKSHSKLQYHFAEFDNEHLFFSLKLEIIGSGKD